MARTQPCVWLGNDVQQCADAWIAAEGLLRGKAAALLAAAKKQIVERRSWAFQPQPDSRALAACFVPLAQA